MAHRWAEARRERDTLQNHRRAIAYSLLLFAATAVLFLLMAFPSTRAQVQDVDDAVYRAVQHLNHFAVITILAKMMYVLGGVWVTLPLRIGVSIYLAFVRRWHAFAAWVLTWALAEVTLTVAKAYYDRPRPPHPIAPTSGFSFPSGHAVAGAATAVALVIAFVPPGHRRRVWEVAAALFATVMALSRVYLNAHWLSDVVAGALLGSAIALFSAGAVTEIRDIWTRRRSTDRAPDPQPP